MGYFISFDPKKIEWRIASSQVIENLLKQWPESQVKEITDPDRKFSYECVVCKEGWGGAFLLNRRESSVYFDAELADCLPLAMWFRRQIPPEIQCVFYEENYDMDIQLTYETSEEEILAAFS